MVKIKSKYILRTNPTPSSDGYIFETDKITTIPNRTSVNGNIVTTTDGGFTFVVNTTADESKKYNNDGFSNNEFTLEVLDIATDDFENVDSTNNKTTIKKQKFVELNKYYSDLTQYCYFGSANAMLNAAINNIINNFPAGIYMNGPGVGNIISGSTINDYTNKFNIDLLEYSALEKVNLNYSLRTMGSSFMDYEAVIVTPTGETFVGNVIGFTGHTSQNSTIKFKISGTTSQSGIIIRPKQAKRDEFFNSLDDFERTILNPNTIPIYKAFLKIPIETNSGISFEYKSFIWPLTDNYNIDIESASYVSFMTTLIDATNFIDEMYCDNLYRMLTHDTIKNLDNTYKRELDEDELEDIIIGGTKIQKILRLYGRSFDEIKKYIEGISFINTITYDGNDNLPIEYLSEKIDNSGWDVVSLLSSIHKSGMTSTNLFPGITGSYTSDDVNNELMRRIIINSKYIFRSKGTKKAIRKLLGILGFDENWYEIREYVQLIDNYITGSTLEKIAALNYDIYPENYTELDGKPAYEYKYDKTLFENTNVGIYARCPICNNEDFVISGQTYGDGNTGVCTFNATHVFNITGNTIGYPQPLSNSSGYYFQQKGNWYRETGGIHTNATGQTYVNEISYGNNPHVGNGEYDNGFDYLDQFNNIFKRFVRNEDGRGSISISGYTGTGFTASTKKLVDNTKISFSQTPNNRLKLNLKNFVIGIDVDKVLKTYTGETSNTITETEQLKTEIFQLLESIALPYLEQLIPATTIFDFVRINRNEPKWLLVDEYPEKHPISGLTGYKIIAYQNVNYFDTGTTGPTASLTGATGIIKTDFGTGTTFTLTTAEPNDIKKVSSTNSDTKGFDNIYRFRGVWPEYGPDRAPRWIIDESLI